MIKPTNTNRRRWYVYAVFLGILLHLIVAVGVTLYIQKQSPDGILKNSDETAYITYGHKVSQNWKTDIRSGYSDLGRGDPHTGYYYIIAALDYVGVSNPVILRTLNVAVGLIGIGLWGLAISFYKSSPAAATQNYDMTNRDTAAPLYAVGAVGEKN